MFFLSVYAMLVTDEAGQKCLDCSVQIEPLLGEPAPIDKVVYSGLKGQTELLCMTLFMSFKEDILGALGKYLNQVKSFFCKRSLGWPYVPFSLFKKKIR